uniref:Uncharacterized protein n=1 Tax=Trypanosoma congolense (strain IL3000) TaxID=1068625 RepID=G0UX72_TRYCI|nr:conserved hypothetical protein [Trypanosoma congolense IL3000]
MSSLAERLVQQLLKFQQRKAELEREEKVLQEKEQQKASLEEQLKQLKEQVEEVHSIQVELEEQHHVAVEEFYKARTADEACRWDMEAEMHSLRDEAIAYGREALKMEDDAMRENQLLKRQLEIYEKYCAEGQKKYNEIMKSREEEYAKLEAKREANLALVSQLEKELEEENERLLQVRKECQEAQAAADSWMIRMTEIEEKLMNTRKFFEGFQKERERQLCRIRSLESERDSLTARMERSKQERDKERAKAVALEEKVGVYRKQIEKLVAMTRFFESGGMADNEKET